MPGWISPWEIVLLALILVLIFGAKRLPEIGRGMGRGMREFKDSITGADEKAEKATPELPAPEPSVPEAAEQAKEPAEKTADRS